MLRTSQSYKNPSFTLEKMPLSCLPFRRTFPRLTPVVDLTSPAQRLFSSLLFGLQILRSVSALRDDHLAIDSQPYGEGRSAKLSLSPQVHFGQ